MSAIAKSAAAFRIQALEKFKAAEKKNKAVMKTKGETRLLKIDLLRRMGQFDEAENICRLALKKRLGSRIRHILQYELYLCKNRDDACRDIETAMEYKIKK
jgi:tetratricopeptide (TPR) repeat protein